MRTRRNRRLNRKSRGGINLKKYLAWFLAASSAAPVANTQHIQVPIEYDAERSFGVLEKQQFQVPIEYDPEEGPVEDVFLGGLEKKKRPTVLNKKLSKNELDKVLEEANVQFQSNLSLEDQATLSRYQNPSSDLYRHINQRIRTGMFGFSKYPRDRDIVKDEKELDSIISDLKKIFHTHAKPISEHLTVWRGSSGSGCKVEEINVEKNGTSFKYFTFTDPALMSTSLNYKTAVKFAHKNDNLDGCVFQLDLFGKKAFSLQNVFAEQEILLGPNQSFNVTSRPRLVRFELPGDAVEFKTIVSLGPGKPFNFSAYKADSEYIRALNTMPNNRKDRYS